MGGNLATLDLYKDPIYFTSYVTTSSSTTCQSLAGNTLFVMYKSTSGVTSCHYGYTPNLKNADGSYNTSYSSVGQVQTELYVKGVKVESNLNPSYTFKVTYYLPSGDLVNNYTYTNIPVPAGTGNMSNTLSGTSSSAQSSLNFTYYGVVSAKQDLSPGIYTDTVVVQVSF